MQSYFVRCSSAGGQATILQKLQSGGVATIQVSDGLCVKTDMSAAELRDLVGLPVETVDQDDVASLPKDVRAFVERS